MMKVMLNRFIALWFAGEIWLQWKLQPCQPPGAPSLSMQGLWRLPYSTQ